MPAINEMVKFKYGLQANYNSLETKDSNTIYFATDSQRMFIGDTEYSRVVLHNTTLPEKLTPPNSLFYHEIEKALYFSQDGESWIKCADVSDVSGLDQRISALEGKPASGITAEDITKWNKSVESNEAITAGTHTKITYDKKGLVTAGADLEASDIPDLTLSKITDAGTAASKDVAVDAIVKDSQDAGLVSAAQVATFVKDQVSDLSGAMHFKGIVTELPESGTAGDVVVLGNKEYVYVNDEKKWAELGDETIYAIKGEIKNSDIASDANIDQSKVNGLVDALKGKANTSDIPTKLPNPEALIVGPKTYDGSSAVTVTKDDLDLDKVDNTSDAEKEVLSATKLATAHTIALEGAVTGTATSFDGSADISITTTAVDGSKVTGTVANATNAASAASATKATNDSDGNPINETYAKKTDLITWSTF